MSKFINIVKEAYEKAEKGISKISEDIVKLDGMSGTKTRHFYNNVVSMDDARYLEIGTWKGSTVCAAMYGNKATVTCIDNWSNFGGPKQEFLDKFNKFKGENNAKYIENDCFKVDVSSIPKINIYLYDGSHARDEHYLALEHYYDCLDDTFIFIVDDWNWRGVREATVNSIRDLDLTVLYEKEITVGPAPNHTISYEPSYSIDTATCDWDGWWNGIYFAVLQKKQY